MKSPGQKLERAPGAQPNSSLRGHIWHRTSSTEMSACDGWALRRIRQNHRYLEVPPGMTVGWGGKEKFPRYYNLLGALLIQLVYFLLNVKPRTTNITAASVQTWEKPLSSRGQEHIGALCEKEKYKLTARLGSQTMQPGGQQCWERDVFIWRRMWQLWRELPGWILIRNSVLREAQDLFSSVFCLTQWP